jgi:hypothetical protein
MKPKLSIYLSDPVAKRLTLAAKRPGGNKSAIVDAALDRYLNPERDTTGDGALLRRLDRMSRQLDRVDRDLRIIAETMALYVRYFLTITPPLAASEQEATRTLGRERFETFVAQVGKRVASGAKLVSEVLDQVSASHPDLFMRQIEEGAPLGAPPVTPLGTRNGAPADDHGSPAPKRVGTAPGRSPAGREGGRHV